MKKVAVVGFGAWGCALGAHAARLGHEVRAWAREPEVVDDVNARHENGAFLPGVTLPASITASTDPERVVTGAEIVLLVPPSKHLRAVTATIAPFVAPGAFVAVASKGIEEGSLELMSQVLAEALPAVPKERVVFLSGPSFAKEVASGLPTDVVAASTDARAAAFVQKELHTPMFRVYTSDDPVGVQIGGAVKNVIAIAAGACDGLGLGTNARAALIARGLAEITRLGVALGADPLTFLGMAGVGDLILTCTGALSRNRELGVKVAEGVDPAAYLASKRSVAEGFWTSAATYALAQKIGVDMPITEQVFHVLHRGRPLFEALKLLMTRDFKGELLGIKRQLAEAARSTGTPAPDPAEIARRYFDAVQSGDRPGAEVLLARDADVGGMPQGGQNVEVTRAIVQGDSVALEVVWDGRARGVFIETRDGRITKARSYGGA